MKIREAMAKTIRTVRPAETIRGVAGKMKAEACGFIPLVDGRTLLGVVTGRDIVIRCLAERRPDPARETVEQLTAEDEVRRLPVIENNVLVGVISCENLEQALHAQGAATGRARGRACGGPGHPRRRHPLSRRGTAAACG